MKKVFYFLAAAALLCTCAEKEEEQPGSISGIILDNTGEPVRTAEVKLSTGANKATGNDGQYEFTDLKAGTYTISVAKVGYKDLTNHSITVAAGKAANGDAVMEKLPPSLRVVSDSKQDISELNFGSAKADLTRSFSIFNDGPDALEWDITYTAAWISKVSRESGTLKAGATQAVVVTINRDTLSGGDNTTTLQVTSDNGSKQLTVKAVGEHKVLPTLNMLEVEGITASAAIFNGSITNAGVPKYTERGFVYSTTSMPTLETTIAKRTAQVTDSVSYKVSAAGLTLNQTYYVRAYAVNSVGAAYSSNEVSFSPSATAPTLSTQAVANPRIAEGTATFNGTIITTGDPAYTERGFVYGTATNPTVANNKQVAAGAGVAGAYSLPVTGIQEGEPYYVRAYATNAKETVYGNEVALDFTAKMPTLSMQSVTQPAVGAGTATFTGEVVSKGDLSYTERGFVYGTDDNPTLTNSKQVAAGVDATGVYQLPVSGIAELTEGQAYHVRAYATNSKGTAYSANEVVFSFAAIKPKLSTLDVISKNVSAGTATFRGNIQHVGDPAYTERGFVYGASPDLSAAHKKVAALGSGITGEYPADVADLIPEQQYYVRAYATTPKATFFGDPVGFKLEMTLPSVSTNPISSQSIANKTATFSGTITSIGDPTYTERGFVYGADANPTVDGGATKLTASVNSNPSFSLTATEIPEGKDYYVRAYATNAKGTAYGYNVPLHFMAAPPALTVQAVTNRSVEAGTATFNGTITAAGGLPIVERGFVYGEMPQPTIEDNMKKTVQGSGTALTANITTGLYEGKLYYVRAYATTDKETTYSTNEESVDFHAIMPTLSTQSVTNIDETTATFNGSITAIGDLPITERGFVYGTMHNPTIDNNDFKKIVTGSEVGLYSDDITGLTEGAPYNVRAYATNSKGTVHGDEVHFIPTSPYFVKFQVAGIAVQKTDIVPNEISWTSANISCDNSTLGGHADWRLPTFDELSILYGSKEYIGGFNTIVYLQQTNGISIFPSYWSSESCESNSNCRESCTSGYGCSLSMQFNNGEPTVCGIGWSFVDHGFMTLTHYTRHYARCVRTLP